MKNLKSTHQYDDIIRLPHHVSKTHPPMPVQDRAAQFAPFAALAGHHDAVKETARLTEKRMELDEDCKAILDGKLQNIQDRSGRNPVVSITYFEPDLRKAGGAYVTLTGCVEKVDGYGRTVILTDGTQIPIDEIVEIEEEGKCEAFQ